MRNPAFGGLPSRATAQDSTPFPFSKDVLHRRDADFHQRMVCDFAITETLIAQMPDARGPAFCHLRQNGLRYRFVDP